LNLAAGVTTVRDMGNNNATLAEAIGRLDRHESIGPHVIPAGFIEGKSQFNASGGILVDSLEGAKQAVDFYAQRGYPQIKIYNSFKPEWVKETAAYAHQRGLRVSGHIPAFMKAEDAVKDGYDEIQHINQVLLNFYVKPDTDTRSLQRFTLIAENANSLNLDAPPFQDLIKLFIAHKTVLDPTLTAFEAQFTQMPGELNPSLAPVAEHLPITLHRGLYKSESEITRQMAPRWRASYAKMLEAVARFHRAGIQIVSGTDDFAGFAFQRELELYVKAGIPANEVLRIATWNGATYARVLADRGSIDRGKRADLILIDGDPTQDISSIRNVALVLQDGDAYYPADLYGELGVKPFAPALKPFAPALKQEPGAVVGR
jgi:Amidohydrolase family